jgi:hypothetical protein
VTYSQVVGVSFGGLVCTIRTGIVQPGDRDRRFYSSRGYSQKPCTRTIFARSQQTTSRFNPFRGIKLPFVGGAGVRERRRHKRQRL